MNLRLRKNNLNYSLILSIVIIVLLLFISVGFAYINITLEVNGNVSISDNIKKFYIQDAVKSIRNGEVPNKVNLEKPNFTNSAVTDEGVFSFEDDYGTSYYFRGAVENNYVKFAGFFWRIIRINGNGTVRIIYDGAEAYQNGVSNDLRYAKVGQQYNSTYNDARYVGYMYGSSNSSKAQAQTNSINSTVKTYLDSWYKTNIVDKGYSSYVADAIFCNDRSIVSGYGYGTYSTYYGAYARLATSINPSFICPNKNDAFTVSDTVKGNGALTYPIGLITGDEIETAGSGSFNVPNTSYYLYKSSNYRGLAMTPYYFDSGVSTVYNVYFSGNLNYIGVNHDKGAVAPVINLTVDYVESMIGTGTMDDPYRVD